ncbi:MAG: HD-GYP domain-containing protein [Firmicutes bacterium]|jgi:HD-GYP domain-containing protein (c-di-GMP phosphodiesterase class II)|nr:HD-GYP domain-containing protein [Bacillota bacterium]
MKLLDLDSIKSGMYLARDILSAEGKVLLARGTKLTKAYLKRLKDFNYTHLYVYDNYDDKELEIIEPVSEKTRIQAINVVRESLTKAFTWQDLNIQQVNRLAGIIVDEICEKPDVIFNMMEIKAHDDYTFSHSVNICIISTIMGKFLGLPYTRLKKLAVGALLHDLGKIYIEKKILSKDSNLTPEETRRVHQHPRLGFDRLRIYPDLSILSAHVAYQHHEREDGSGYPRGLCSEEIHPFAKIVAVADSYDAMVSKRPYRKPVFNHIAIAELKANSPTKYDLKVTTALTWAVAPYPIGSVVLLANKEKAVVTNTKRKKTMVQIIDGKNKGEFIEITKDTEVQIADRLA